MEGQNNEYHHRAVVFAPTPVQETQTSCVYFGSIRIGPHFFHDLPHTRILDLGGFVLPLSCVVL